MWKSFTVAAVCALIVCAAGLTNLAAFQLPDVVTIVPPHGEPRENFEAVDFSHAAHADISCYSCHHAYEGCGEFKDCGSCHTDRRAKEGPTSFFAAWHSDSEYSCLGCHKAAKEQGQATGPMGCFKQCHSEQ